MKKISLLLWTNFLVNYSILSQSTFSDIVSIFQAKCTYGCHSGPVPSGSLDLSGTPADVYAAIYKMNPSNLSARGEGMKLISPGNPLKSFLLKKINNHLEPNFELNAYQGAPMPKDAPPLSNEEIELVRQWIQWGAKDTGVIFNQHLIQEYYRNGGKARINPPSPPAFGQGLQIHFGPFFLAPRQETELFKKHPLDLPDDIQVYRMEVWMNTQSHHFILWKFYDNVPITYFPDGVRDLYSFPNVLSANSVFGWQYSDDIVLPQGTAYFWNQNTVLDLDYHIFNYPPDSILAAEVFINIYYYPKGTVRKEMISLGEIHEASTWRVPADGEYHTYSGDIYITDPAREDEEWDIWLLSSHTHKYGVDFDIYMRNPDGTRGEQVYEGFYDTEYQFDQGYYNFAHPPIRRLISPLRVKAKDGLIYEATFRNTGSEDAYFGPTTKDEMLVAYYQYTLADKSTAVPEIKAEGDFITSPNPFRESFTVAFVLNQNSLVNLEVFNILGEKVRDVTTAILAEGPHTFSVNHLPAGIYKVRLTVDGNTSSRTVVSIK